MKKILCPVELWNESTNEILEWAVSLSKMMGDELILLHVSPDFNEYAAAATIAASSSSLSQEVMNEAEVRMEKLARSPIFEGVKVSTLVLTGLAADLIVEVAEGQKVDMIVMGTHGRKGVDRFFFGSVAEKVVRTSSVPVLTIRPTK